MRSTCPVCESHEWTLFLRKSTPEGPLELRRCARCTHGFLSHQPEDFENERYDYYLQYIGKPRESRQTDLNATRYRELLDRWATTVRGRRLLDVGCGDGHLVRVAGESGWLARGIDMSKGAIELARSWGIPCERLDFFDSSLDAERYDVIYMSELIEHVPVPARFIARAAELLAPGGTLYVTTPNFDSLARRVLGGDWGAIHFEHLSYFNERSFRELARRSSRLRVEVSSRNIALPSIVRGLRQRVRLRRAPAVEAGAVAARGGDQALRARLYSSPALLAGMRVVNRAAGALGIGDTLVATLS